MGAQNIEKERCRRKEDLNEEKRQTDVSKNGHTKLKTHSTTKNNRQVHTSIAIMTIEQRYEKIPISPNKQSHTTKHTLSLFLKLLLKRSKSRVIQREIKQKLKLRTRGVGERSKP